MALVFAAEVAGGDSQCLDDGWWGDIPLGPFDERSQADAPPVREKRPVTDWARLRGRCRLVGLTAFRAQPGLWVDCTVAVKVNAAAVNDGSIAGINGFLLTLGAHSV